MKKHAYLVLAHRSDATFRAMLSMIDDERNDVFIHMDARNAGYDPAGTERSARRSRIRHTPRTFVRWGGYSVVNAELLLLDAAVRASGVEGGYGYYHLISGQDLPIRSQDEIHGFFAENAGKEFVSSVLRRGGGDFQAVRVRFYHLSDVVNYNSLWGRALNRLFWRTQQILRLERNGDVDFRMGSQWWSITDAFARYVLSRLDWIKRVFRATAVCDEVVFQTLLASSKFAANQYRGGAWGANMRFLEWESDLRHPRIIRTADYERLMESGMMFARKFDAAVDGGIMEKICREMS